MSIITGVKYIESVGIKFGYVEDNFTGYKITTSDDETDKFIQEKIENVFPSKTYSSSVSMSNNVFNNILFMITNNQSCCENFGVKLYSPPDANIDSLIGLTIKSIKYGKCDDTYSTKIHSTYEHMSPIECIIDLDTNGGLFKFVIFNDHNGYYPRNYYFSFNEYYSSEEL
jgi:hypothetical protein